MYADELNLKGEEMIIKSEEAFFENSIPNYKYLADEEQNRIKKLVFDAHCDIEHAMQKRKIPNGFQYYAPLGVLDILWAILDRTVCNVISATSNTAINIMTGESDDNEN